MVFYGHIILVLSKFNLSSLFFLKNCYHLNLLGSLNFQLFVGLVLCFPIFHFHFCPVPFRYFLSFLITLSVFFFNNTSYTSISMRKKCPYSELLWSAFARIRTRITPNTDIFHVVFSIHTSSSSFAHS